MKITSRHYSLIAIGILLLATGFTISKSRVPTEKNEALNPTFPSHQSRQAPRSISDNLHRSLSSIESQSNPERLLRLISTIERSTLDTLPDLATHFVNDSAILRLISLHWFNLDPQHHLQTVLDNRNDTSFPSETLIYFLLNNWIDQDFSGLVQAIDDLPLPEKKWWGFTDILMDIVDIDYEIGFSLMRGAELADTAPNSSKINQLAAENPTKIADSIRQEASGYALTDGLGQIAIEWAKTEPEEALAYALSIPGKRGSYMSNAAITSWSTHNPEAAADWITTRTNARVQDELRPALLKTWSKQDPEVAHHYCLTNLSGFRLRQALKLIKKHQPSN